MQTQTIQRVKPAYQRLPAVGGRRCDYLNQRKIEAEVEKHDQVLRKKYNKNLK